MTKQQEDAIIDKIITALGTYNLGNIQDSRTMNMMLATFILCSCFIDHMAQIRYFVKKKRRPYLTNNFEEFVGKYFGVKYKPKLLYDSLRSRLVHNYSVRGKYWLTDERKYKHLQVVRSRIYLNIDDFIKDIEAVWTTFRNDLLNDPVTRKHAIAHESVYPVLKEETFK